jgi:hypothetical protein
MTSDAAKRFKEMKEFLEIDARLCQRIHETQMRVADEAGARMYERDDRSKRIEAKLDEILRRLPPNP